MVSKIVYFFGLLLIINGISAFKLQVKRDTSNSTPDIGDIFKSMIDEFRRCIDQMLSTTVDIIDAKQLQPVFSVVGDKINRVNKAYNDLTAPSRNRI